MYSNVQNKKSMPGHGQQTESNIRHRFFEVVPRMSAYEMKITSVLQNVKAPIMSIGRDHGFIAYKLDQELLESTLGKNGARPTLPENNGKIFFHQKEVSGPLDGLKVGDQVEFNLVHVKTNNKIIAHRVALPDEPKKPEALPMADVEAANQLAHFQRMQLPVATTTPAQPKIVHVDDNVIGSLVEIVNRNGTGHAFIESKKFAGSKILLMFEQLIGTDISVMKIGDNFKFRLFRNNHNGRLIARSCEFLRPGQLLTTSSAMGIEQLGHFQFMEAPTVSKTMEMPKFTPILPNVYGTVQKVMPNMHCGFAKIESNVASKLNELPIDAMPQVFFHQNDLVGLCLSTLAVNDKIRFEIVRNNQNGKYVAKSVQQASLAEESLKAISGETGMALDKALWKNMSTLDFASSGKGVRSRPCHKTITLLNDSQKRRRSVDTLNKITASTGRSSNR